MNFVGTEGNDTLLGTAGADVLDASIHSDIDESDGGLDSVRGFGDDDTIKFGQTFAAGDVANGGGGNDTLTLEDHVGSGVILDGTNIISIETIRLTEFLDPGLGDTVSATFNLVFGSGLTSANSTIAIDASALENISTLNIDLFGTDADVKFSVETGAAHGQITCGPGGTSVFTSDGAVMKVIGSDRKDAFSWTQTAPSQQLPGAAAAVSTGFNVNQQFDGGAGNDSLTLWGDMSGGVVFKGLTMRNIETLTLLHGYSYDITFHNGNVADDAHLTIEASGISGTGTFLHLDASTEAGGDITIFGGGQTGVYKTGAGDDFIYAGPTSTVTTFSPGAGHDHVFGSSQQDIIQMGAFLDAGDRLDGISGVNDEVDLNGDYSAGVTLANATIKNIDNIVLAAGHSYSLTFADGNVASGKTMIVDGSALGAADSMAMKGAQETDGQFDFRGGDGNDTFFGGAKDDDFHGGGGADTFSVGSGFDDLFYEGPVSDSTGLTHDIVKGFDVTNDFIGLNFDVVGQSSLNSGRLRASVFDGDLAAAVNGAVMGSHTSVAFTPNAGSLAGHHFLVIDANGTAGYQAGQDFVIEFVNPTHWGFSFNYFTGA